MMRSKAVVRLREERRESALNQIASLASWQSARRQRAKAQRVGLAAEDVARRDQRMAALSQVHTTLDDFANERERLRLEIDMERSAHLASLVSAVNDLTADFHAAGDDRKRASMVASTDVKAFLGQRRALRQQLRQRQAEAFHAFRIDLAQKTLDACREDFR